MGFAFASARGLPDVDLELVASNRNCFGCGRIHVLIFLPRKNGWMVNEGEGKGGGMKKAIEFSLASGVEQLEVRRDVILQAI